MLTQVKDLERVISEVVKERAHAHMLKYWADSQKYLDHAPPVFLPDDRRQPTLVVAHEGSSFIMFARKLEGYHRIADDLFHERIEQDPPWPDEEVKKSWENWVLARGLFVNSSPLVLWELMNDAGFEADATGHHVRHAYLWTIEGEPRLSHLIKHPCRLNKDEKLWELLRRGISYDEEGEYIRMCLK